MWRVTGRMATGDGKWTVLPDFLVEAESPSAAQEAAVQVHSLGKTLSGPIDFAVHSPETDRAYPGHILLRGVDPGVGLQGGVWRLQGV